MKLSGFNFEDILLTDIDTIAKLVALVMIAYTWAYKTRTFLNRTGLIKNQKVWAKIQKFV